MNITWSYPAGNYMFKVNIRNSRTGYGLCSKLTIKTPERRKMVSIWCLYCYCYFTPFSSVSVVNFEQVNSDWVANIIITGLTNHTPLVSFYTPIPENIWVSHVSEGIEKNWWHDMD